MRPFISFAGISSVFTFVSQRKKISNGNEKHLIFKKNWQSCQSFISRVQRIIFLGKNSEKVQLSIFLLLRCTKKIFGLCIKFSNRIFKTEFYISSGTIWSIFLTKNNCWKIADFEQKFSGRVVKTAFHVYRWTFLVLEEIGKKFTPNCQTLETKNPQFEKKVFFLWIITPENDNVFDLTQFHIVWFLIFIQASKHWLTNV